MKAPINRGTLLVLQVLVGLAFLVVWHLLTTVPMADGKPLMPPFFFSSMLAAAAGDFQQEAVFWQHIAQYGQNGLAVAQRGRGMAARIGGHGLVASPGSRLRNRHHSPCDKASRRLRSPIDGNAMRCLDFAP